MALPSTPFSLVPPLLRGVDHYNKHSRCGHAMLLHSGTFVDCIKHFQAWVLSSVAVVGLRLNYTHDPGVTLW